MAGISFEAFFWSIAMQESGGSYGAVGPQTQYGRAYGKYQVLEPNIGPWTQKYYGKRLTPQQFLANPEAQEAVARGKLKSYYDQYGPKGAAAMWYSGQPDPTKTYGHPPVSTYVNSVIKRAQGHSGQKTGGGATVTTPTPRLDEDTLASSYGLSMSLINSSKELKKIFKKAVAGQWSGARFQAELKNSKWWKTQSDSLRQFVTLKHTDPATFNQNWKNAQYKVNQLAVEVGLKNQIRGGKSSSLLKKAIYNSLALGWSDERVKDWLGTKVKVHKGDMYGEAGEVFDQLHEIAYMNGMKYGDWYATASRAVVSGKSTMEREEAKIRREAAAKYSGFSDQIKAGQNVIDLASPYISAVSSILELPETDVDLFNSHVKRAMTTKQKDNQPYSLWKFENDLRSDPMWRKTNNARESMTTVARQVLKDFGLAF